MSALGAGRLKQHRRSLAFLECTARDRGGGVKNSHGTPRSDTTVNRAPGERRVGDIQCPRALFLSSAPYQNGSEVFLKRRKIKIWFGRGVKGEEVERENRPQRSQHTIASPTRLYRTILVFYLVESTTFS